MIVHSFDRVALSELVKSALDDETENSGRSYFSVDVDTFCIDRIQNLRQIGFLAKMDDQGQFDFDVMDTLIQYKQNQAEVFLQVPFDFPMDPYDLLVLCSSIDINVLLMPPEDKNAETWRRWSERACEYTDAMLNFQSFSREILPVTSFVQYLSMRVMSYTPPALTDDPMMQHFFEEGMCVSTMDALKETLEDKIFSWFGSHQQFEEYVHSTLSGLYERVEERSIDMARAIAEKIENVQEADIPSAMTGMLNNLGITHVAFIQLVIDLACDARRSNISLLPKVVEQLAPEGISTIPPMFIEAGQIDEQSLQENAAKAYAFLRQLVSP